MTQMRICKLQRTDPECSMRNMKMENVKKEKG